MGRRLVFTGDSGSFNLEFSAGWSIRQLMPQELGNEIAAFWDFGSYTPRTSAFSPLFNRISY
jgi:hypothetical protein